MYYMLVISPQRSEAAINLNLFTWPETPEELHIMKIDMKPAPSFANCVAKGLFYCRPRILRSDVENL